MANFPKASTDPTTLPTTTGGRLFIRHIHDLYSTLVVSLTLKTNRQFFKMYPNSFTSDEAISNLSSLKFSQSTRSVDPNERSRVKTVTTTTSFSMNKDAAKGILNQMLEAKLFENAADMAMSVFKDRSIWILTPKGLDVLARFIKTNNIHAPHLVALCASSPFAASKPILYLPRRSSDDSLDFTHRSMIEDVFRRFAGLTPPASFSSASQTSLTNTTSLPVARKFRGARALTLAQKGHAQAQAQAQAQQHNAGRRGSMSSEISVKLNYLEDEFGDIEYVPPPGVTLRRHASTGVDYSFTSMSAVDWLEDFSSVHGIEEASTMCAHWVRMGFIAPVDGASTLKVKAGEFICRLRDKGERDADFRASDKVVYRITPEGASSAWINNPSSQTPSYLLPRNSFSSRRSSVSIDEINLPTTEHRPRTPPPSTSVPSVTSSPTNSPSKSSATGSSGSKTPTLPQAQRQTPGLNASTSSVLKDSNAAKLHRILEEPALRSLFRQHMRENFCEENLSFWLDVEDLKRRYASSSSAGVSEGGRGGAGMLGQLEKHQQELMDLALILYTTYLAPSSPSEINVHSTLRNEVISYLSAVIASETGGSSASRNGQLQQPTRGALALLPRGATTTSARVNQATQLQIIVGLYERAQRYIFKGMSTDSVPKFCQTERVIKLMRTIAEYESSQVAGGSSHGSDPSTATGRGESFLAGLGSQQQQQNQQRKSSGGAGVAVGANGGTGRAK
ncbi:regulator of G protein signaling domain-containing protein [Mrakia frigida]|uniref:regulator of G protein signaling domain-containing protein n=1 Tax=Mrakia frigida TaxID=29902 RepID=UPI003FCBF26E